MLKILIISAIGSFWASIEGTREAYSHHNSTITKNVHPIYFIQRILVMILSIIAFKWQIAIYIAIGGMLVFSFWHNGSYYTTREKLSPGYAPKKWRDHRDGSALMDIPFLPRTIMMVIGYIMIICAIYLNNTLNGVF